jgi:hypothetical protein
MASKNHQKVTEWHHTLPADGPSNNGTYDVETSRVEQSTSPGNQSDSEWDYTPATDGTSDLRAKVDLLELEIRQIQKALTSTSAERDAALAGKFAAEAKIEELKKVLKTAIRSHTDKTSTSKNTHSSTYDLVQTLINILRTPPRSTDIWSENPIVLGTQNQKTQIFGDRVDLAMHVQAPPNLDPSLIKESIHMLELINKETLQASPYETPINFNIEDQKTPSLGDQAEVAAHVEVPPNIDPSPSMGIDHRLELFRNGILQALPSNTLIVNDIEDQKTPPLGDRFDLTSDDQAPLNNVPLPGNKSGQGLELFDKEMSQASPAEAAIVIDDKDQKTPPPGAWVNIAAHSEASPNIDPSSSERTGQGFELFDKEALHEVESEVTRQSSSGVSDSDTAMSQEKDVLVSPSVK